MASEQQQRMPLGELEASLARAGYVKFPGTDEAYVDENEKRSIEESLEIRGQQARSEFQQPAEEKPKPKSALAYIIFGVLLALLVFGVIGAFVE